jgi:uncharacterized alkaline shock family protein YloU
MSDRRPGGPDRTAGGLDTDQLTLLADRVAEAAAGCPGVARLAPGPVATYLPGRTVPGVSIGDGTVRVGIVGRYGAPLPATAERVREAVRGAVPGLAVDVTVEDVE